MTKKSRFGSFIPVPAVEGAAQQPAVAPVSGISLPLAAPTPSTSPAAGVPAAPVREERRAFSTRVRPSQKAALDEYVMELKRAGWPVSQEAVLEELLRLLQEDSAVQAAITTRLTRLGNG